MPTYEVYLIILSLLGAVGTPLYLYFRSKMTRSDFSYSRKHIFKVITLHMATMAIITLFHSLILLSFFQIAGSIDANKFRFFVGQILLLGGALYGGGIYITCILVEHFSAPKSKQWQYFRKTIRFLHGPLSHTIFEVAYMLAFWNTALIAQSLSLSGTVDAASLFFIIGAVVGSSFSLATIGNGTYLIYTIATILALPFFLILVYWDTTMGVFSWGFTVSSLTLSTLFLLGRVLSRREIKIYQPINFF